MKIITGVIGNDVHAVANRLIEIELQERGHIVFNLGVNTKLEEFIDALIETKSDALLISSLNGEAESWTSHLHEVKVRYKSLSNALFVIGGNLSIGESSENIERKFKNFGFDMVFHQSGSLLDGIKKIEARLSK
jgi:methylaspartate mutase sigma subunit